MEIEISSLSQLGAVLLAASLLAGLVESTVEFVFGTPFDKFPKLKPYKWTLMYLALAVGVAVSVFYEIDLVAFVVNQFFEGFLKESIVGFVLTGFLIGRGGNVVHQFISKYLSPTYVRIEGGYQ